LYRTDGPSSSPITRNDAELGHAAEWIHYTCRNQDGAWNVEKRPICRFRSWSIRTPSSVTFMLPKFSIGLSKTVVLPNPTPLTDSRSKNLSNSNSLPSDIPSSRSDSLVRPSYSTGPCHPGEGKRKFHLHCERSTPATIWTIYRAEAPF